MTGFRIPYQIEVDVWVCLWGCFQGRLTKAPTLNMSGTSFIDWGQATKGWKLAECKHSSCSHSRPWLVSHDGLNPVIPLAEINPLFLKSWHQEFFHGDAKITNLLYSVEFMLQFLYDMICTGHKYNKTFNILWYSYIFWNTHCLLRGKLYKKKSYPNIL